MAEILASWLNEEVGLSRVSIVPLRPKQMPDSNLIYVCNSKCKTSRKTFLADTCSVSCFGSLTSSRTSKNFLKSKCHAQQRQNRPNQGLAANLAICRYKFDSFYRDAISHRLQNFEKLEPSLRNLNIKFDSKMVDKIMKRERGIALRLLYQLKMVLEKVYPVTDIAVLTKTGQFGDNQPAQKIAMSKEKYDRVQHQFFKQRINALNKPQK